MVKEAVDSLEKLSLGNLHQVYHENHARWPRKVAAEVAFALAVAFKRASDNMREGFRDAKNEYTEMAIGYAAQCFTILSRLPADSLEDVAPTFTSLAGVAMPNYFYLSYITNKDRCSDFVALLP